MPDYPHRGPNASRIRLEGAGGLIFALTPVLILLLGAPLVLVAWVALGAILAPVLYWRHRAGTRSLTHLGGAAGSVLAWLGVFLVGSNTEMRLFVLVAVVGGILGAVFLCARSRRAPHPSIRDHSTQS